mgnify:CR=1 FL=1
MNLCYLDRFEGDKAVLLISGREIAVPASILPGKAREGDHLLISISIDSQARDNTENEITDIQERLEFQDESE